jgi:inositol-phosphate phosphatase / L-galactose 1-phosphate phosphatase / histidinol-phosphatase
MTVTQAIACHPEHISIAHSLADAAATITTRHFRTGILADTKSDDSPVTVADREAEAIMKKIITERCPEHGIFGEEQGYTPPSSSISSSPTRYLWVLDPIDGTKSFITGKPLFGTLIALLADGVPILGIIDQPVLKERWVGIAGQPTTLNSVPITTRPCTSLRDAYLYATSPHMFSGYTATAFARLRDAVRIPLYGCDCYAYGLLAAGHCDIVAEADLKPYDYMALVPIIEGAGGVVTDWRGGDLRWDVRWEEGDFGKFHSGEVLATGDAETHRQALQILKF